MRLLLLLLVVVVAEWVRGPWLDYRGRSEARGDVAADGDVVAVEASTFRFRAQGTDVVAVVRVAGLGVVCGIVAGGGHDAGDGAVAWEHAAHATVRWGLQAEVA